MASTHTGIAYADATWNPFVGCTPASAGCDNCYAAKAASRMAQNPVTAELYRGIAADNEWTGAVRPNPKALLAPTTWRTPKRIMVASMFDPFHADVGICGLLDIWRVIEAAPRHTYMVLTKRAVSMETKMGLIRHAFAGYEEWPFPHAWMGVTVENQSALVRVAPLKRTPAAVRWLSIEPLLEDLGDIRDHLRGLDWVVIGCESGYPRRPCPLEWVRSIVAQCAEVGVACYVKQITHGGGVLDRLDQFPEDLRIRQFPAVDPKGR